MPAFDFLLNDDDGLLNNLLGEEGGRGGVVHGVTEFLLTGSVHGGDFVVEQLLDGLQNDGLHAVTAALENTLEGGDHEGDLLVEELVDDITGGNLDNHNLGNVGGLLNDTTDLLFG
ncbi:hypothetical protein ACFQ4O_14350 [Methylopila musalis]|uniref:Uncharacterized protein n=1 Tax=Methylopila musalis TaxID=1134781 RepID=A0ABW3ZBJ5_9HYPH